MSQDETAPETPLQEAEPDIPTLPARERADAPIVVGLGGSAGAIEALQAFFRNTPPDSGMAFVVVVHLAPDQESRLAEVLQRDCALPIRQVTDTVRVEPDHVYVIPPSKHLEMSDGTLRLTDPPDSHRSQLAIDPFFRTLAMAQGPQSVAVVLSGAGSDGALGLRHVKEMGGLAVAQEAGDAEFDAMPRQAIATGMVDFVLPARDMCRQIIAYRNASQRMRLPAEAAPSEAQRDESEANEQALADLIALVRAQTGHDFAHYKRATVLRRIGRRLQLHNLENLTAYLEFLRRHPPEADDLLGDLLISVTQFFRDREAWDALEQDVIPRLFDRKETGDQVRVWVCGCATGEEAYSLAMLLCEHAARLDRPPRLQVFATDMNATAVAAAREGRYPETIAADVSQERLRRWFYRENGYFVIRKEVREIVLFATHDILQDTPFSRLDLITCRNMLIYLDRPAQEQVFDVFHFALRTEGRLFLGASESVNGASQLFSPLDKRNRIYLRRPVSRLAPVMPPSRRVAPAGTGDRLALSLLSDRPVSAERRRPIEGTEAAQNRLPSAGALHRSVLEMYAPPSALITGDYQILHLSNSAGRYLRLGGGEPSANLLQLVHPDLRVDISTALYAASSSGEDQSRTVRAAVSEGEPRPIRITVRPVHEAVGDTDMFLVLFEEVAESTRGVETVLPPPKEPAAMEAVRHLEEEVARLQVQLHSTVDQYEASVEELKAANEEQQAINEELRSAAEELETSREELQSVNEELSTVNQELKNRVDEISRTNADLQNLFVSTDIATLFLDRELCIKRFTPAAEALFNIIPTDIGRPLAHLTHRLNYPLLHEDADTAHRQLKTVEREVSSHNGRDFLVRLLPYRTLDDRIDGVVINFVDVTARKQAEAELRESQERFGLLVEGARDYAMFLLDTEYRITFWSASAERVFGWTKAEAVGRHGAIIYTPEDREKGAPQQEQREAVARGSAADRRWHVRGDDTRIWCDGALTRLDNPDGSLRGFAKVARDATEERRAEEALQRAHDELERRVEERTASLTRALAERRQAEQARQELLRQLVSAEEEERARLSRELHDQTGQHLTGFMLGLNALKAALPEGHASLPLVDRLQHVAADLSGEVHHLAWSLRPPALDDLGLAATLTNYVQEWEGRYGVTADLHVRGLNGERLPGEVETTVYRIVQETLTNVARHARAARASIVLDRRRTEVRLIVEDDGIGFDAEETLATSERLGLRGIRERVALLDGSLEVESTPGKGTTLYARIPLKPEDGGSAHA